LVSVPDYGTYDTNLRINSAVQQTNFAQITSSKMLRDEGLKAKKNAHAL
jgi:hypothetical protein